MANSLLNPLPRKTIPPSNLIIEPVNHAPARDARYNAVPPISASSPKRPVEQNAKNSNKINQRTCLKTINMN